MGKVTWLLIGTLFSGCAANHPPSINSGYVQVRSDVNYRIEKKAETLDLLGNLLYLFSPEAKSGQPAPYYFSEECRFAPQEGYPFEGVDRKFVKKVCEWIDAKPKDGIVTDEEMVLPLVMMADALHKRKVTPEK
jgi:hypothetical protein